MAEICVIVPVYKVERYLSRCVDSILNQTFQDFELVLVDDGSPDRCADICEAYAAQDSRITVLHRANGGLSAARNTGIEWMLAHSQCEFLTFIDSDDWVHPQYLQLLYDAARDVGVAVAKHRYVEGFDAGAMTLSSEVPGVRTMDAQTLLTDHTWFFNYAWAKLYRRELFGTLRYPEGKNFEDTFTTYRALFASGKVALIDRELYCYFHNSEGISHAPWNEKELVVFEGMRAQMDFYREHGYDRALEKEEWLYVNHYAYQLIRIRENREDWQKNRHFWRELRREMLTLMRSGNGKYTFRTMPQCFAAAYPRLNRLRELRRRYGFLGIVRKVKQKLGG